MALDGNGNLLFNHALVRDSAYDGLSYRLRRELHSKAAEAIRAAVGAKSEEQAELLSIHFFHAQRYPEAWSYSLAAAERAKAVYANIEAAESYERALLAGRRLPQLTRERVGGGARGARRREEPSGAYVEAAVAYRSARRLLDDDAVAQARLALKLARVQGWLDRYASVLRWLTKGLNILKEEKATKRHASVPSCLPGTAAAARTKAGTERAIKWCTLAVAEAEAVGHKEALADALRFIDYAKMELGQLEEPVNWVRALALFEELDNLPGQSGVLNMLGMFAYFRGEWDKALELYQRAQATVHQDRQCRHGRHLCEQHRRDRPRSGPPGGRRAALRERLTRRAGGAIPGRHGLCEHQPRPSRGASGSLQRSLRIFEESIAESRDVGAGEKLLEAQARKAECLMLSGEVAGALSLAEEGLLQPAASAACPLRSRCCSVCGERRWPGPVSRRSAEDALEQSLTAARERGAEYEVALSSLVMAEVRQDANPSPNESNCAWQPRRHWPSSAWSPHRIC